MGWLLTLGRLIPPTDPTNEGTRWLYLGQDGSEHAFYSTLHDGETETPSISYTRDSSYLRMREVPGLRYVDLPDGAVHTFDSTGKIVLISDLYNNYLSVSYPDNLTWKLTDHDDADRYADVVRDSFDGLGHYRETTTGGTFSAGNVRTTFTNYNPGYARELDPETHEALTPPKSWPSTSAWVLNTYTEQTVTEGGVTAKTQTCFEPSTGFLLRSRTMVGTTPGSHDVITARTRDEFGNVVREESFGGDVQSVSTSNDLCALTLPANREYVWSSARPRSGAHEPSPGRSPRPRARPRRSTTARGGSIGSSSPRARGERT